MSALVQSLAEAASDAFESFAYDFQFVAALEAIWSPFSERRSSPRFARFPDPTPWSIAFTPTFRKSVAGVDKKMQGRILTALSELSEEPVAPHGDTIKPLVGEQKGLWRYRVGDYRLVYQPRQESRTVVLLDFAARGGVYE